MKYTWSRILFLMFLVFCGCGYTKGKEASSLRESKRNSGFSSIPSYTPEAVKDADLVKLKELREAVKNLDLVSMENLLNEDDPPGAAGGVHLPTVSLDRPIDPGFLDRMQSFQHAEVSSIGKLVVQLLEATKSGDIAKQKETTALLDQACLTAEATLNQKPKEVQVVVVKEVQVPVASSKSTSGVDTQPPPPPLKLLPPPPPPPQLLKPMPIFFQREGNVIKREGNVIKLKVKPRSQTLQKVVAEKKKSNPAQSDKQTELMEEIKKRNENLTSEGVEQAVDRAQKIEQEIARRKQEAEERRKQEAEERRKQEAEERKRNKQKPS